MHLVGLFNYIMFTLTIMNMIRIFSIVKFDIWIFFGLAITGARCFFQLRLGCMCCDSIRARRNLMYCMNLTTAIETFVFICQCIVLFSQLNDVNAICAGSAIMPTLGIKTCGGVLSLLYSMNGAYVILYMYFCCVCYEHYFMALSNPALILKETQRLAR
jgi:hypothetical protein